MDDPPRPSISSPQLGYESEGPLIPPPTSQPSNIPPFDVTAFRTYLAQLLPLVIGANPHELEILFESSEFTEKSTRWATDVNAGALYVVKSRDEVDELKDTGERPSARFQRTWELILRNFAQANLFQKALPILSLPPSYTLLINPLHSLSSSTYPSSILPSHFLRNFTF